MNKLLLFLPLLLASSAIAQLKYPPTRTVSASDTYFGVTYQDPYRWLENMQEPEVHEWFKQQAALSNQVLGQISGREELVAEWKRLDALQPPRMKKRQWEGGRLFYIKTMPGENVGKLYFREGLDGKEQLLFDPATFIPGKTLSIGYTLPSHDGKKIAICYAEGGSEIGTIRILDVDTRTLLPEVVQPSWGGASSWTFDNKAFVYDCLSSSDPKDPNIYVNNKVKLHRLGDDVANDIDFLSTASYPALQLPPSESPVAGWTQYAPDYIFADLMSVRKEYSTYFAPASQLYSDKKEWKRLCRPEDQLVLGREFIGNDVYSVTYRDAPNYKVVRTTLPNPDWSKAETVIPEQKGLALVYMARCRDYLLPVYSDGVYEHLFKYHLTKRTFEEVKTHYPGLINVWCLDKNSNNCFVEVTSWNKPRTEFSYQAETGVFSPSPLNQPAQYPKAYLDLQVEEVEVKGHDGTLIPLTIIYRKGLKKNGQAVCFMESYGAYGTSMSPLFSMQHNSLAVRGVVVAFPHVRGGSERGDSWYKAGFKTTKPNTWKDFNSCAEYLIANGYTSPGRLAGTGTSAGGILISRALTERPDLYAAAICNVGCANIMRNEFSPNGPANIPEFGTVTDSTECRALYQMDGLQHVQAGTRYPALLSVAGWNDPRVIPWQPGKFAAAMQQASASGKPVLLKVNYDNGHFTEVKQVTFANFADQYAFVLWQCGHPDFQPRKKGVASSR